MTTTARIGVTLDHILDRQALAAALADGHVRAQEHPDLPYAIFNYTEQAAYEGAWSPVTLTCRGLVVDRRTDEVLARPFPKFFNHGQPGAPALDLHAAAVVTDKLDGSLGVLYPTPAGWAVATRGSFTSDQARHATALLRAAHPGFVPPAGLTVLVEIVYPGNRIVLDYGGRDELILLGAVDIATGRTFGPDAVPDWPGPAAEVFGYRTLAEALAAAPRPNAEGLVVHLVDADLRVKLKQEDYVALHRVMTGFNARTVWQSIVDGQAFEELVMPLPDEFHPWCRQVVEQLTALVEQRHAEALRAYDDLLAALPAGWLRRDFAAAAVPHPWKWALFLLLDGKDIRPQLWRGVRPEATWTPSGRSYGEDTA